MKCSQKGKQVRLSDLIKASVKTARRVRFFWFSSPWSVRSCNDKKRKEKKKLVDKTRVDTDDRQGRHRLNPPAILCITLIFPSLHSRPFYFVSLRRKEKQNERKKDKKLMKKRVVNQTMTIHHRVTVNYRATRTPGQGKKKQNLGPFFFPPFLPPDKQIFQKKKKKKKKNLQ